MTQKQIKKERVKIEKEIKWLNRLIEIQRVHWKALQSECEHPNEHQYSACGELGWYCPDCGHQT